MVDRYIYNQQWDNGKYQRNNWGMIFQYMIKFKAVEFYLSIKDNNFRLK